MADTDTALRRCAAITARLDRLPTTRYIWTLVLLLSLGGCFEFYDLFLMTYIGPGLVRSGLFATVWVSFFGSRGFASFVAATFVGLFIGTLVFGFAADTFGRRAIFTGSLLWYTVASVVMAFQSTAPMILLWRTIAGIGTGVELVTIDTHIAELMPRELRGRAVAINQVVQFSAVPIVAFVSWLLVPRSPLGLDGWRWVVLIPSASSAPAPEAWSWKRFRDERLAARTPRAGTSRWRSWRDPVTPAASGCCSTRARIRTAATGRILFALDAPRGARLVTTMPSSSAGR